MSPLARTVLVTGAGGFIGSHLAERLVKDGFSVRALVHYNSQGRCGWLDESTLKNDMEIIAADITDVEMVRRAVKGTDAVFHLAALIAIPYSFQAVQSYVQTNVSGTLNVLQAALDAQVRRVVHTSTSEVYGTAQWVPITEDHPLRGQSPYSASKIAADKLAEAFHLSFGLPVVTVRPFNTFGPRQSARAVIPTIISQLLAGPQVRLGHVHPTRDLNYVANTVDGFVAACDASEAVGKTVNLGSGTEMRIGDLAALIGKLMNTSVDIISEKQRQRPAASEVDRLLASNALAKKALGWTPLVSLEDGLLKTIPWVEHNRHRFAAHAYAV